MVSVTGNALVRIIIVRHRRMRTVTNYFILNLSVADLAVTCICIPFDIPVQENDYRWPYGGFLCRTLYPLQTMVMLGFHRIQSLDLCKLPSFNLLSKRADNKVMLANDFFFKRNLTYLAASRCPNCCMSF